MSRAFIKASGVGEALATVSLRLRRKHSTAGATEGELLAQRLLDFTSKPPFLFFFAGAGFLADASSEKKSFAALFRATVGVILLAGADGVDSTNGRSDSLNFGGGTFESPASGFK